MEKDFKNMGLVSRILFNFLSWLTNINLLNPLKGGAVIKKLDEEEDRTLPAGANEDNVLVFQSKGSDNLN